MKKTLLALAAAAAKPVVERCTECGIRFGYHSADCSALTDLRAAAAEPAAQQSESQGEAVAWQYREPCPDCGGIHGGHRAGCKATMAPKRDATPAAAAEPSDWHRSKIELTATESEMRGILLTKADDRNKEQEARLSVLRTRCLEICERRFAILALRQGTAAPAPGNNVGAWVDYAPVYEFALLHKLPFNELSAMVRHAALATPAAAAAAEPKEPT